MELDTKTQYLAAVERLAELARARQVAPRTRQELWSRLGVVRSRHILEVGLERDERGRAVYSNEDLRRAALAVRLDEDQGYKALVAELRQVEAELDEAVTEHNKVVDQKVLLMFELGFSHGWGRTFLRRESRPCPNRTSPEDTSSSSLGRIATLVFVCVSGAAT